MPAESSRNTLSTLQIRSDLLRTETLDGRKHLVVPVIPVVAGVHNGEMVPYNEIAVFPDSWSGVPLPIDHPTKDGKPVTANSPEIIESSVIGRLFNVIDRDDIQGISGELWIDMEKAITVPGGEEVLRKLQTGEQLEVSTAYNTFVDDIPGEFINKYGEVEKFSGTQRSLRPDHLALLPFATGACNWRDGCGAPRVNNTQMCKEHGDHAVKSSLSEESAVIENAKSELKINGKYLGMGLSAALAAHAGVDAAIKSRLSTAAGIDSAKLDAIIAGTVDFVPRQWANIFSAILDIDPWEFNSLCGYDNSNIRYSMNISKDDKEEITVNKNISTDAVKDLSTSDTVESTLEVKPCGPCEKTLTQKIHDGVVKALKALGIEKIAESVEMEKEIMPVDKKPLVDAVIASKQNKFIESHREWLTTLTEDQLAAFEGEAPAAVEVPKEAAKEAKAAIAANAAVEAKQEAPKVEITSEMITAALGISQKDIEMLKNNAANAVAARTAKIAEIAAIEGCQFSKEDLEGMSDTVLAKTAELFSTEAPYRVALSARKSNSKESVPAPPAILMAVAVKSGEGK